MTIFRESVTLLTPDDIAAWLRGLRPNAHAPLSGYLVSSVLRVPEKNGRHLYFAGVNVENAEHRLSTHGEEGALSAMVTALGKASSVAELWVMGAPRGARDDDGTITTPCGLCRQKISGFAADSAPVHCVAPNGKTRSHTIGALLPGAFSFRDIGLVPDQADMPWPADPAKRLVRMADNADIEPWLQDLHSWDFASGTGQAVILALNEGRRVAGVRVEDAAYAGTSAMQAALANACAAFGEFFVTEVFMTTAAGTVAGDRIDPPPLSAWQCLSAFTQGRDISATLFSSDGQSMRRPVSHWVQSADRHS
jgi:cytidine deaminase